jgi:L-ascorbate metabolism protein UlaG (beta-lactamase superfamily)
VLPIDGWGPRVAAGHLDARRAAEALRLLQPSIVVPVHWGTFHPVFATVRRRAPAEFVKEAAALAPDVAVRVLGLGETLAL